MQPQDKPKKQAEAVLTQAQYTQVYDDLVENHLVLSKLHLVLHHAKSRKNAVDVANTLSKDGLIAAQDYFKTSEAAIKESLKKMNVEGDASKNITQFQFGLIDVKINEAKYLSEKRKESKEEKRKEAEKNKYGANFNPVEVDAASLFTNYNMTEGQSIPNLKDLGIKIS